MSVQPGRPTVDDVALLLRARTKDDQGNEVGTFDGATRPTDVEVDQQITVAMALVGMRFPDPTAMTPEEQEAFAALVAYRAALRIEKAYWPEQVRSDRSPYPMLLAEYQEDLAAFEQSIVTGAAELVVSDVGEIPVASWTSL